MSWRTNDDWAEGGHLMGTWKMYKPDREEDDLIDMMQSQKLQHLRTIRDLKARVKELEAEIADRADTEQSMAKVMLEDGEEIKRLREAIIDAKRLATGEPWRILDSALDEPEHPNHCLCDDCVDHLTGERKHDHTG
jgi:hypothetical protein